MCLTLTGPRWLRSEDERFFPVLANLQPGDARVFLVLPVDGEAACDVGRRRR